MQPFLKPFFTTVAQSIAGNAWKQITESRRAHEFAKLICAVNEIRQGPADGTEEIVF